MRKKGAALRKAQDVGSGAGGEGVLAPPASAGEVVTAGQPPLPDFAPVPRKYRHDGWTPERQRAFVEALADTGCVTRAASMVNMAQTNCYALRRAPGAEEFRRAWDAALDFGLKRLKDIAFERAVEGELIPVFQGGKLIGFRRKRNDALLMFCLRHYGQDAQGRRTTINYFSSRSSAGAAAGAPGSSPNPSLQGEGLAAAEASATTVRTVITGSGGGERETERLDGAAALLERFEGVTLDAQAAAAIAAALEACAARSRALSDALDRGGIDAEDAAEDDPEESFFRSSTPYRGELVSGIVSEEAGGFVPGESDWRLAGAEMPEWAARYADEALRAAEAREEEPPRE